MPLLVRSSLLGLVALAAIVAAIFVVKLLVAVGTIVLTIALAIFLFRQVRTFVARHGGARSLTIYRG